ncbi:hypothetical protein M9H77_03344 [Catharanthus roseus]|uniref:Uncharacterized protein n=1 Tax=Catharanthus roseus TaxID=4058 RepID=A0ACC0CB04_CATRO|nr:hypothetical protein M9H77_03344 [Catharanthus roseus]
MYLDRASLKKFGLLFLGRDAWPGRVDLCYKYLSFNFGVALILEQSPTSIFSTCLLLLHNRVSDSATALKDSSAGAASWLQRLTAPLALDLVSFIKSSPFCCCPYRCCCRSTSPQLTRCSLPLTAARGRYHHSSRTARSLAVVQPLLFVTIAAARFGRRCSLLAARSPPLVVFRSF